MSSRAWKWPLEAYFLRVRLDPVVRHQEAKQLARRYSENALLWIELTRRLRNVSSNVFEECLRFAGLDDVGRPSI